MYKIKLFYDIDTMIEWLNQEKFIEPLGVINGFLVYWEEEPQPQQKDLIPESDKPESL